MNMFKDSFRTDQRRLIAIPREKNDQNPYAHIEHVVRKSSRNIDQIKQVLVHVNHGNFTDHCLHTKKWFSVDLISFDLEHFCQNAQVY